MKSKTNKTAKIFFFSGTGNAEKSSYWISETFNEHGISTEVLNIAQLRGKNEINTDAELIGICSPTHGFNMPPVVLKFLFRMPRGKHQKAFIVNTRAGMKMGKLFLPGLSGLAQLWTALILSFKGYKIIGMRPIDMPSNWMSLHPGIKHKVVLSIMHHCKTISQKFASKLASGKKDFRALFDLIQDLLIAPISLAYYFIGRFILAKTFYADKNCTHCYKCVKDCPIKAINVVDSRPYWTHKCESCMHCMNNCPTNSIQTAHGLIIGLFYIISVVSMKFGWNYFLSLANSSIVKFIYDIWILKFTVESAICLVLLLIVYRLTHYLLKFSFFERIIYFTSLTSYKFWRRFNGNKIRIE